MSDQAAPPVLRTVGLTKSFGGLVAVRKVDFEVPAGWFQSFGPIFVISLAPVMAGLWVWLARRNRNPSLPLKFAFGLLLLGIGFLVMACAARFVTTG